jgi:hypothetical protein
MDDVRGGAGDVYLALSIDGVGAEREFEGDKLLSGREA